MPKRGVVTEVIEPDDDNQDRRDGLPRSNYYDGDAMREAIQKANPKTIDRILRHPTNDTHPRTRHSPNA